MKRIIPYGLLVIGVVLCLYSPIIKWTARKNLQGNALEEEDAIGQIKIPKIVVNLPIYKGTEEDILQRGIGCIEKASPLGSGKSAHSILAGHRGLLHADLFLRLDELEEGDCFLLHVEERELVYEVCNIQVIRPDETGILRVQEGRDLVSLVTCTPYGINTHRLVVTGERKE